MWPKDDAYASRYFVPDLSPEQRQQLKGFSPNVVFVAESPHVSEIEPEVRATRRPLCGKAGLDWWRGIAELIGCPFTGVDLESLLGYCRAGGFAVLNAVQYPIDPRVADPVAHLGFSKVQPASFKILKSGPDVCAAIDALRVRLVHPSLRALPVVSLGNDSKWFIERALRDAPARHIATVPHPSAWWRRGGFFREKARGQLTEILKPLKTSQKQWRIVDSQESLRQRE